MNPHPSDSPDPKQGEREYYARSGEAAIRHGLGKPFNDAYAGFNLANLSAIYHLLPTEPTRIVEFGCGIGWLSYLLARSGHAVTGIDIAPEAIAAAQKRAEAEGLDQLHYKVGDYEEYDGEAQFDTAIFYDALHHAEDADAAMACAYRALSPGGMLIAFEPGEGHHDTPESIAAVEEFGVHENDMPSERIIALGRAAGFSRHLRLPHPWSTNRLLYRPGYGRAISQSDLRSRYRLSLWRLLRHLLRRRPEQEFVVLWK